MSDQLKGIAAETPQLCFAADADWEQWLEENGAVFDGIWLQFAKKGSGIDSVSYLEAVETALCFGWIDGQKRSLDEKYWLQKFTPRRRRSIWSRVNRDKVEALIAAGRMRPAGMKEIDAAKADGRWDAAYESQSRATVPEDLQAALDENPAARTFFESLRSANRYAILFRVQTAGKPEARAARIAKIVGLLAEGKTVRQI